MTDSVSTALCTKNPHQPRLGQTQHTARNLDHTAHSEDRMAFALRVPLIKRRALVTHNPLLQRTLVLTRHFHPLRQRATLPRELQTLHQFSRPQKIAKRIILMPSTVRSTMPETLRRGSCTKMSFSFPITAVLYGMILAPGNNCGKTAGSDSSHTKYFAERPFWRIPTITHRTHATECAPTRTPQTCQCSRARGTRHRLPGTCGHDAMRTFSHCFLICTTS